MDSKPKKVGVSITQYWFNIIFSRAIHDIREYISEHFGITLLLIVFTLATSILSANGVLDIAVTNGYLSDTSSSIRILFALLIISALYVPWSFLYFPVKIYNEKEQEISDFRKGHSISNVVPDISLYATLEGLVYDYRGKDRRIKYTTKRYFLPLRQVKHDRFKLTDTDPVFAEISFYGTKCNRLKS